MLVLSFRASRRYLERLWCLLEVGAGASTWIQSHQLLKAFICSEYSTSKVSWSERSRGNLKLVDPEFIGKRKIQEWAMRTAKRRACSRTWFQLGLTCRYQVLQLSKINIHPKPNLMRRSTYLGYIRSDLLKCTLSRLRLVSSLLNNLHQVFNIHSEVVLTVIARIRATARDTVTRATG